MTMDERSRGRLTKHRFALTGRASASAGALGVLEARPAGAPAADAPFDLGAPSVRLLEGPLLNGGTLRSFAFDNVHGQLYLLHSADDGLHLTRCGLAGDPMGRMTLRGFGDGSALGCDPADGTARLWIASDPDPASDHARAVSGFAFADGAVLSADDASVTTHRPVPDSTDNRPSVDARAGRLLLHYRLDGAARYRLLNLADLAVLHDIPRPAPAGAESGGTADTLHGFALLGDHVYQLTGPAAGPGNRLSCVDLRTGALLADAAAEGAPRGIAVQLTGTPRLCTGSVTEGPGPRAVVHYREQHYREQRERSR